MRTLCVFALAHAVVADLDISWTDCGSEVGAHGVLKDLQPATIPAEEAFNVELVATLSEGFNTATYKVTGEVDHLPIPALKGDICGKNFTCPVKAGDVNVKLTTSLKTSVINNAKVRAQVIADTGDVMLCADLVGTSRSRVALTAQTKSYASGPNSALCSPCVQLGGQGLNILINEVLNAGVIGGCGKLCGHLSSTAARDACDLMCGVVGIKAFIKALNNTDLDPIYFCEIIHACEAGPDDAHVDLLSVQLNPPTISKEDIEPASGGVTVEGVLTINVTKHSGVGEFSVGIHGPVEGEQGTIGGSFILADGLKEGVQNLGVKVNIQDTLPDPTKQPPDFPVTWMPGSYEFRFHVCQGECGSKHPHSVDFGRKSSNFTISESQRIVV